MARRKTPQALRHGFGFLLAGNAARQTRPEDIDPQTGEDTAAAPTPRTGNPISGVMRAIMRAANDPDPAGAAARGVSQGVPAFVARHSPERAALNAAADVTGLPLDRLPASPLEFAQSEADLATEDPIDYAAEWVGFPSRLIGDAVRASGRPDFRFPFFEDPGNTYQRLQEEAGGRTGVDTAIDAAFLPLMALGGRRGGRGGPRGEARAGGGWLDTPSAEARTDVARTRAKGVESAEGALRAITRTAEELRVRQAAARAGRVEEAIPWPRQSETNPAVRVSTQNPPPRENLEGGRQSQLMDKASLRWLLGADDTTGRAAATADELDAATERAVASAGEGYASHGKPAAAYGPGFGFILRGGVEKPARATSPLGSSIAEAARPTSTERIQADVIARRQAEAAAALEEAQAARKAPYTAAERELLDPTTPRARIAHYASLPGKGLDMARRAALNNPVTASGMILAALGLRPELMAPAASEAQPGPFPEQPPPPPPPPPLGPRAGAAPPPARDAIVTSPFADFSRSIEQRPDRTPLSAIIVSQDTMEGGGGGDREGRRRGSEIAPSEEIFEPFEVDNPAKREQLQNLLRAKGFDPGPTDGVIGAQTNAALDRLGEAYGEGRPDASTAWRMALAYPDKPASVAMIQQLLAQRYEKAGEPIAHATRSRPRGDDDIFGEKSRAALADFLGRDVADPWLDDIATNAEKRNEVYYGLMLGNERWREMLAD